ncbi:O-antigen ligase family protein [Microbacterium sp. RG1]|uniref:O-antigen ligase family protein n=1 Tax=Microbacterium sp. RG1 TaxID=2489212 RepID=UPI0013758032|nr:O-antigen ligase family protein [Microbacterium sp. RG1]
MLVLVALATVSWDRLLNITMFGFNVKVPTVCFAAALSLALLARLRASTSDHRPAKALPPALPRHLCLLILAALAMLMIGALISRRPVPGLLQIVTVILGAVVPLAACVYAISSRSRLITALDAFIWGGVAAAAFGVYQYAAGISGWPQLIPYEDLGGGLPRISSFLYESGYFGYFMVLVISAVVARHRLAPTGFFLRGSIPLVVALVAVTLLANTRAAYLTLPLLGVLLVLSRPRRLPRTRTLVVAATAAVVVAGLILIVFPTLTHFLFERVASILDPTEVSSNAPRLAVTSGVLRILADNFWLGIGPGNLFAYAPEYDLVIAGSSPNTVVANNAYLQALLDGGPMVLLLQVAIAVALLLVTFRWSRPVASALATGWLAVASVAFVGTSYFWDLKLWAVAGLALAAAAVAPRAEVEARPDLDDTAPTASAERAA